MTMVTIHHLRTARICARGSRAWMQANGLSWDTFLSEGYDAEMLRATGDPIVLQVVAVADREKSHE